MPCARHLAAFTALLALGMPAHSQGMLIEVSQELTPDQGNWQVLGVVRSVDEPMSIAAKYAYAPFGYNGSHPSSIDGTSLLFVHRNTSIPTQVSVVAIHGATKIGGKADQRIQIVNDPNGVDWRVQDEPAQSGGPPIDKYTRGPAGNLLTTNQHWAAASDGYAVGYLSGPWEVLVSFDSTLNGQPMVGLNSWLAYSGDGSTLALNLVDRLRVRLRLLPETIETYCHGKTNSLGCVPFLTTVGVPSAAGTSPFLITGNDVLPAEVGFLLYGLKKANLNFHGGKLCVKAPVVRLLPPKSATANGMPPCSGTLGRNFNARIQSGIDPQLTAGQLVHAQWRQRDPADPAGFGDLLTDGVRFTILP